MSRFCNVGSHLKRLQINQNVPAVVALIRHKLFHTLCIHFELAIRGWFCDLFRHRLPRRWQRLAADRWIQLTDYLLRRKRHMDYAKPTLRR